jgi:hypothetical protein
MKLLIFLYRFIDELSGVSSYIVAQLVASLFYFFLQASQLAESLKRTYAVLFGIVGWTLLEQLPRVFSYFLLNHVVSNASLKRELFFSKILASLNIFD